MAATKPGKAETLAAFYDEGTYTALFADGPVSAAYGCANGQSVYVVYQNGQPLDVSDIEKTIRVLKMAAETGAPVVTFYNSNGACLEGGLKLLNANSELMAQIARISGVVPQIAVVTGICAGSAAVQAAAADLCIMSEEAELFLNAPFNSDDKIEKAGSAAFAARAGVAAVTAKDALDAAQQASRIAGLMPSNNLAGPAVFDFAAPAKTLNLAQYAPADAAAALADADSVVELYGGYGKAVYTALATVGGMTAGIVGYGQVFHQSPLHGQSGPLHPPVRRLQHPGFDRCQHRGLCAQRGRRHGGRHPSGGAPGRCLRRSDHRQGRCAGR